MICGLPERDIKVKFRHAEIKLFQSMIWILKTYWSWKSGNRERVKAGNIKTTLEIVKNRWSEQIKRYKATEYLMGN